MKLKQAILSLLLCLISVTAQAQQFSPFIDTRLRSTATGTKPAMRSGALLELIGYTTATDGFHSVVQYLPGSALVVDNVFVFAPAAGQPGRLVAVDRSFIDLEFAGLSNNADITTLLDTAADNMTGSVFRMRLPRTLTNLTCSTVTFPSNLKRFEVYAGNCTITQDDAEETMWILTNPQNVFIERGVKFVGSLDEEIFTASTEGLIKINGAAKSGTGGVIECHADFSGTTSTGLAVVGVALEANAYQSIKVTGKYTDSGINASSYALTRTADADIYDLTNYNGTNSGARRYTNQPNVLQDGYPPLQGRPSLSQGNYDRAINVRTHHGHDELANQVGVNENAGAYIYLPAGSTWQLTDQIRIPSGVTITTDPNNPATIIHPVGGQNCIAVQGAGIIFENFICDYKSGETWQPFQNFFNHTMGGFYSGPGASNYDFAFDNITNGQFRIGENVTFSNGTTARLVGIGNNVTVNFDGQNGIEFIQGETVTFPDSTPDGIGIAKAVIGSGTTGTVFVTWVSGPLPADNANMNGAGGSTAKVNGTPVNPFRATIAFLNPATPPVNDNTFTGSATGGAAQVSGTVSLRGSAPQHPIRDITYRNLTFINSDDTRRNFSSSKRTDANFNYDNESGTFVEGETVTYTGGSGVLFQLNDAGTTGSMILIYTGSVPVNNTLLTGATNGATAQVNGTVTTQSQGGDNWSISFVSNSGAHYGLPASDVLIENCRNLIQLTQLTANGSEQVGWKNVTIRNNYVKFGHANAIAMSSLADVTTFENILIEGNEIDECTGTAIYVGLDPDATGIGGLDDVSLTDIVIRNNKIKFGPEVNDGSFPIVVLVRCTGNCKRLRIEGNTFDNNAGNPLADLTFIDLRGNPVGPDNTYTVSDNVYLGQADFEIGSEYVQIFDDLPLLQDLVAWFPLDEANTSDPVLDVVGPTGRSTLTATNVTATADGPGGARARTFNGTNQRAIGADLDWTRVTRESFGFSAWVRIHTKADANCVIAKWGSGGSYQLTIREEATPGVNGEVSWNVRSAAGASANILGPVIPINTWTHITCWYDWPSNLIGIAVNGGTPVYAAGVGTVGDMTGQFNLGYDGANSSSFFDGDMSQIGFWRGRVLSSKDRTNLYNAGSGMPFDIDDFELVIE